MTNELAIKSHEELQEIVAASDTGGRNPSSKVIGNLIIGVCILWSLFQLYYASPLPFKLQAFFHQFGWHIQFVIDETRARCIHLSFALFLAFLSYPAGRNSPRHYVPITDWVFAFVGAVLAVYYIIFFNELNAQHRFGNPNMQDIICGCIGLLILLEATRRSLGLPLVVIAGAFLCYNYFGKFLPSNWVISHHNGSLNQIINTQWITDAGVFGTALKVSTNYVFPFVLFGALLDKAGAGNYFIKTAFAYLGSFRGGPAKAAVVASGLTGLISGSSIANVVTTGTFTIPMMKRVGFAKEKAGAVEVASSVNGQIMPPVMGAAAFLIMDALQMPYKELMKHAFLPALISYIALVYIVHLEACKQNMKGIPSPDVPSPLLLTLIRLAAGIAVVSGISLALIHGMGWLTQAVPAFLPRISIICVVLAVAYILLVRRVARFPDLEIDEPNTPIELLPSKKPTVNAGLHFLLPVIVLLWFLMIEQSSPGLAAFWGVLTLAIIQFTQRPLLAFFRQEGNYKVGFKHGFSSVVDGLAAGARNMIGIGLATASAGIIVGVVAQTDLGAKLSDIIELLSFGQLILILIWVAIFSLILGMGLPTTANYIVVSTLMAGVIVELGRQNGLVVPLIAVHLFVFYFGIMADVTPPVGLASFAAAAISGGDPIKTGVVAFFYSLRTALLPFLFIFNTDLLLIDVGFAHGVLIFIVSTIAMLAFTAATMGWFFTKNKWWDTAVLLLITAMLFRPGFFMDYVSPSTREIAPQDLVTEIAQAPIGGDIELHVSGVNKYGKPITFYAHVPVEEGKTGEDRLQNMGLTIVDSGEKIEHNGQQIDKYVIDDVAQGSEAHAAGLDWDQVLLEVYVPDANALSKYWMYIPGILLLMALAWLQMKRATQLQSIKKA